MSQSSVPNVVIRADHVALTEESYSIGQLAKMFRLSLRAIRFYCERELIRACDYRHERTFDRHNVRRLALIQIGKDLGFTLREIAAMLRDGSAEGVEPYLEIAPHRVDVEIARLNRQRSMTAERLRWLLACKRTPMPDVRLDALSA